MQGLAIQGLAMQVAVRAKMHMLRTMLRRPGIGPLVAGHLRLGFGPGARVHRPFCVQSALREKLNETNLFKQHTEMPRHDGTSPSSHEEEVVDAREPERVPFRKQIMNVPNLLTLFRMATCPVIAWYIVKQDFDIALGLIAVAGTTDLLDGFIARRYKMSTTIGSILDPAADKFLMTTLVGALTYEGSIPPLLAGLIIGRDVILSLWAFVVRYQTLPPPKTFKRFWDLSKPSAVVQPSSISKINTFFQLSLVFLTIAQPFAAILDPVMGPLQWTTGATTLASGLWYILTGGGFKRLPVKSPRLQRVIDRGKTKLERGRQIVREKRDGPK